MTEEKAIANEEENPNPPPPEEEKEDIANYIDIKINDDNMFATLTTSFPENFEGKITLKALRELIVKSGIKSGYVRNNIENTIDAINNKEGNVENVLIAKGIPEILPVEAKLLVNKTFTISKVVTKIIKKENREKESIKDKFKKIIKKEEENKSGLKKDEMEKRVMIRQTSSIVSRGTVLADLILPVDGREGKDVLGNILKTAPSKNSKKDLYIVADKNVLEKSFTGKKRYFSKCNGVGFFVDNKVLYVEERIDGSHKIKIDEDKNTAYLCLQGRIGDAKDIDKEKIIKELEEKKIKYHDYLDVINESIEKINNNEEIIINDIVIAQSKPPIHGQDGYVKYNIDFETKNHKKLGNQRINHKALNKFKFVEKDFVIGEIIPPTAGVKDGENVFGEPIPALKGHPVTKYETTNNVYLDNKLIKAKTDGLVFFKNNMVYVNPVLAIEGNIDYSVGNIDFNGDVIINGNVLDDFEVKTKGSITVNGFVEAAYLEAGGNIVIRDGIFGKYSGKIKAKNTIKTKFCENAYLEAGGNILVEKHSVLSTLKSKGDVAVGGLSKTGGKGKILGGNIIARNSIRVHIAGNEKGGNNINLILGYDFYLLNKIKKIQSKITSLQFRIMSIDSKLNDKKIKLTTEETEAGNKEKKILTKTLNKILSIQSKRHKEVENHECKGIYILDKIFPNNKIQILEEKLEIKNPQQKIIYKITEEKQITMEKIEEKKGR